MKTTANFKLKKPDLTDVADIEVLNSNSDILDKIIKDLQNAQFTEQQARQIFALISHKHNTSDINNLTSTIQQTKVNSAAYADNANKLDNLDSTDFMRANKGDGTLANDLGVAKELRWKHYGQNHVIFDASNGTTPTGRACNNTNPEVGWSATYPTLMGWNGSQTYGVRVANAGWADGTHNTNLVKGRDLATEVDSLKQSVVNGKQTIINGINSKLEYNSGLTINNSFADMDWWIRNKLDRICYFEYVSNSRQVGYDMGENNLTVVINLNTRLQFKKVTAVILDIFSSGITCNLILKNNQIIEKEEEKAINLGIYGYTGIFATHLSLINNILKIRIRKDDYYDPTNAIYALVGVLKYHIVGYK